VKSEWEEEERIPGVNISTSKKYPPLEDLKKEMALTVSSPPTFSASSLVSS